MIKPTLQWPGSKMKMMDWILSEFPEHKCFVDVFGGSGAVLLNKIPSNNDVYNDLNGNLATLFKVLCNKDDTQELVRRLDNTLYSRDEFNYAKDNVDTESDPIERARLMFVLHNQSFSGLGGTWGYGIASRDFKSKPSYNFRLRTKALEAVQERLRYVQVENLCFSKLIPKYDTPETLFYLDPPYVHDSRVGDSLYRYELSDNMHNQLVEIMLGSDAMFILSGYENDIYKRLEENGYQKTIKQVKAAINSVRNERTEVLWISPNIRRASLLPLFMENSLTSI